MGGGKWKKDQLHIFKERKNRKRKSWEKPPSYSTLTPSPNFINYEYTPYEFSYEFLGVNLKIYFICEIKVRKLIVLNSSGSQGTIHKTVKLYTYLQYLNMDE